MNPSRFTSLFLATVTFAAIAQDQSAAELRVPANTAYISPDPRGARVSKDGVTRWTDPKQSVEWFGEFKNTGKLTATVELRVPKAMDWKYRLTVAGQSREVTAALNGDLGTLAFGEFEIAEAGYVKFQLTSLNPGGEIAGDVTALVLDGPAAKDAHFNLEPRRNAASVHLAYPVARDADVELFYNEVIAVEDPTATFYMACGFSRGYFGMQVNSPTERRIIFSVWDSGAGGNAKDRSSVADEDHVQLLAKGDGVEASVFGNEGTGGHSHLVHPWRTGSTQRFIVTAKPDGDHTIYTGYWFHPTAGQWTLIASFRAPKDGKWLRGLHSFSENFDGASGHIRRKALFGPAWVRLADGTWQPITEATFSHDPTGKANRLDRFMGVEDGHFFLSHGGFVPGSTKYGERFTRPAPGEAPQDIQLPEK